MPPARPSKPQSTLIGSQIAMQADLPAVAHSRRMFVALAALPRRDFVISWAHGQVSSRYQAITQASRYRDRGAGVGSGTARHGQATRRLAPETGRSARPPRGNPSPGRAWAEGQKMSTEKLRALHTTLAEIFREPPLISTNTEPSPPTFFDEEPYDAAQDRGEVARGDSRSIGNDTTFQPTVTDAGLASIEIHEAHMIVDAEEESPGIVRKTLAEQTPVDAPADTGNLAIRAEQAKSLLVELGLETAIRLRWAMRDIRSKRTKMSPVSENDLAALIDLGLVEMREGTPRLTGLGVLALD